MIYDYKVTRANGEELDLATLKGKVIMVVNTATGCGFTPQYAPIEDLQKLSKLNEQHFLIKRKGRKSRNKKIFKYDLKHNLLNTYVNRNACINAEQISKQSLVERGFPKI